MKVIKHETIPTPAPLVTYTIEGIDQETLDRLYAILRVNSDKKHPKLQALRLELSCLAGDPSYIYESDLSLDIVCPD